MSRSQNLVVIGLLIAVAAATVIWLQLRDHPEAAPVVPVPVASTTAAAPVAAQGSAAPAAKPRVRRLPDPSGRDELLRQIRALHAQRTARPAPGSSSGTMPTPPPALPPATIEKEYIRASVRELIPLLAECYEQGLTRDPKLAGSIIVDFTIEGEPAVGGVVGESAIDPAASTLTDPAVRECVQETMFGIEIEPPEGGGVVKVRYPFEFRSDPD